MADNHKNDDKKNNRKYDIDSPSNRSLSTLIDQDLQKESELLQNLIEEVFEANKKVKASHQRRLEDTEEKMRIMNREIKRLRDAINHKDEETTKAQFDHLLSSKDKIHDALRAMRLYPLKSLINESHHKSAEGLKETLFERLETILQNDDAHPTFMRRFKESAESFIEKAYENGVNAIQDDPENQAFKEAVDAFNEASKTFINEMTNQVATVTGSFNHRAHVLSDGSLDTSLKERVESTFKEKKAALEKESAALEEEKKSALETIDQSMDKEKNAIESKIRKQYEEALEKEKNDQKNLDEDLKQLKLDIITAEKHQDEEALKDLLKTYEKKTSQSEDLVEHKVQRKIDKAFRPKLKQGIKQKRALEKDYAKKQADIERKRAQLDVQFSGSDELFKVQGDLDAFKEDLSFNKTYTTSMQNLADDFDHFIESIVTFTDTMRRFMIESRMAYLKEAAAMTRSLGDVEIAFKASQTDLAMAYRKKAFTEERTGIAIKSALRRQAITMHYHRRILAAEKALNDTIRQADIDKTYQQESAQNEKIYQQGLIELADKEYELQLLKVRSLYDNEIALTRAQAERLNVGHDVNEAMVSTTLESQMHFARQQIKYAENEYQIRLENIESTLNKELEYAEEKLSTAKQAYRSDIYELTSERDRKLSDLAYRQALFTDPKDKRKLDEQEAKIREYYDNRIEKIAAQEKEDDTVQRYQKQIDNAKARAEKAKEDARNLKEKTIGTFKTLLEQSEQKLSQYNSATKDGESLGPYIESEASKTAEKRLNEAIEEANRLYKEKVRKPQKRIEALNETINSIEFDAQTQSAIEAHKKEVESLREAFNEALDTEQGQTKAALDNIHQKEKAYEEKVTEVKEKLSSKDRSAKAARFEKEIETLTKRLEDESKQRTAAFKAEIARIKKEHHQAMDALRKTLDETIEPTLRAYEKFTKKASTSQNKALKKARKQVDERLKNRLKDIDNTYSHQL